MPKKPYNSPEPSRVSQERDFDDLSSRASLGDFDLRREIGRGGMGTVYEAWQRSLSRVVAIKVLGRHISSSATAVQRFQREAQAAAKLHHTHITPIFAQGMEHGVYYYAMELINGPSLHAIISAARDRHAEVEAMAVDSPTAIDPGETVALSRVREASAKTRPKDTTGWTLRESGGTDSTVILTPLMSLPDTAEHFATVATHIASIADALDYAHQQGVIHRDIKPHNLLLGTDGRMRITDFGLARVSEQVGVTMTGELVGSPLYMSPEQILQDRESIDHRTDIYSLGVTMYEWLTLRSPYPGETREQVISLIAHSEPLPMRAHNPAIPVALETVCLKAIERDRRKRYGTGGELRDDLRRFLSSQPIKARRAGRASRAGKFVARHQPATWAAVAAAVAIILTGALYSQRGEIKNATATVQLEKAAAQAARKDSDQMLEALNSIIGSGLVGTPVKLAEAGLEKVLAKSALTGDARGVTTNPVLPEPPAGTPQNIAHRATQDFYITTTTSTSPAPADDDFALLLAQARELRTTDPGMALARVDSYLVARHDDADALQLRAALYARLGQYARMVGDAEALIRLRQDDPAPYLWRAVGRFFLNDFDHSLEDLASAARSDSLLPWCRAFQALILLQTGKRSDAISCLDQAISSSPDLVVALLARSIAYGAIADMKEARARDDILKALADVNRVVDLEPANADALTVRGQYYAILGDFAAAIADFDRAMSAVGRTPALLVKWTMARLAQRNVQNPSSVTETLPNATPTLPTGDPTAVPSGQDVATERMQEWFSRYVWPRTPDGSGPEKPSLQPQ